MNEFDKIAEKEADLMRYHIEQTLKDLSWEEAHPNKFYGDITKKHLEMLQKKLEYHERRIVRKTLVDDMILRCPTCNNIMLLAVNYCPECGQRLEK